MTFTRGRWECGAGRCKQDAAIRLQFVLARQGGRTRRIQAGSPAVRLCDKHFKSILNGNLSESLVSALRSAVNRLNMIDNQNTNEVSK